MPPATIGPFEIVRELGRGGMGEVFLARDTRLDRQVAIKALPDHLATDMDRLTRFQREAKVLASLNHPGIGAIYGLQEESAGNRRQYLILEFVQGQTLADRIDGPIPVPDALAIAKQIAEALEAAHEKGIIHRDLKPGNVMVTPEGVVKVLDFGIARMPEHPNPASPVSPQAATVKSPAKVHSPTIPGALMGSPGYMSPEQALGKEVDKRSDIFAFGCVLYEVLTGVQAFPGENVTASLAAVLHVEPDWSRLPADTPPRTRELLLNLLTKERRQRLHDMGDARLALEQAIQNREWVAAAADPASRGARRAILHAVPWILAASVLGTAAATSWRAWAGPLRISPASGGPIRLRADVPEAIPYSVNSTCSVAISPDGSQVAYVSYTTGRDASIIVRRLDDTRIQSLLRFTDVDPFITPIAVNIFFSPDGRFIAGFQQASLFMAPVAGGEPTRLFAGPNNISQKGGAWIKDGILFSPAANKGLMFVSERGGDAQEITVPDSSRDEISHRFPDVLPDGRRVLMTIKKSSILTFDDAEIALLDLETKTWKTILKGGSYARYVPTGHIIFARNASVMAVPFDEQSGRVTGAPVSVLTGVMTSPSGGTGGFAVARDNGTLVYTPGGIDDIRSELVWIGLDGKVEPVGAPVMQYYAASLSPDGSRIASGSWGANDAIFIYDLARRASSRITFRGNCNIPQWLPGGSKIAYSSDVDGPLTFYTCNADGSGTPERIGGSAGPATGSAATVDGNPGLVVSDKGDIWFQPMSSEPPRKLISSQFEETMPCVSPDGRFLSYASNETGQFEVYIREFPSGVGRRQVSVGGGWFSCWMPKGEELVYIRETDRAVYKASVRTAPSLEIGAAEPMFTLPKDIAVSLQPTLDGTRFLSIREVQGRFTVSQVNVVLNWFDELRAKVPVPSK